jgi:hypothetical protein
LIIDLKARCAGETKKQTQAEEARQDTLLQLQTLGVPRDKLPGQVPEAYNLSENAKKSDEEVEKLKTQVKQSCWYWYGWFGGSKNCNASRP